MTDRVSELEDNPLFVRSLAKAFKVLDAFDSGEQYLGLVEIMAATQMDKSTVQRFVFTLHGLGFLERDPLSRRYGLGKRLLGLSFNYLRANPLVARATPVLIDLRKNVQERVGLSLWEDLNVIYAVRLQSKRETFFATLVGRRMPLYCTSGGWAIMSLLPEEEAIALLERCDRKPLTALTQVEIPEIMEKVRKARTNGYALNVGEALPGEITLSAAVADARGRPIGAVHVSGSLAEWAAHDFQCKMAPLVVEAARAVG